MAAWPLLSCTLSGINRVVETRLRRIFPELKALDFLLTLPTNTPVRAACLLQIRSDLAEASPFIRERVMQKFGQSPTSEGKDRTESLEDELQKEAKWMLAWCEGSKKFNSDSPALSTQRWEDTQHGTCAQTLMGHESFINVLCTLNEALVCSGSGDATLKVLNCGRNYFCLPQVWDVDVGKCSHTMRNGSVVTSVCSLGSGTLFSGDRDNTLKVDYCSCLLTCR